MLRLRIIFLGDFLGVVLISMYVKLCHVIPRCIELNIMPCLIILRFVRVNTRSMHDSLVNPICVLPLIFCCRSNAVVTSHNFCLAREFFLQSMLKSPGL